jgi:hypothetical protein
MRDRIGPCARNAEPNWKNLGNVRRYFGPMIDFLLTFHPVLQGEENGQKLCYIRNTEIELALYQILEHEQSQLVQFVGYKGTGKSTVIRGAYDLWEGSGVQKLVDNTLVLYCSFNSVDVYSDPSPVGIVSSVRNVVEGVLSSGLQKVRSAYRTRCSTAVKDEDFIEFVKTIREDLLLRFTACEYDNHANLKAWEEKQRLTYLATRLKFEFNHLPIMSQSKDESGIASFYDKKQILIVFDDIEGLIDIEARKAFIQLLIPLWNCLRNGVSFPLKILLAERPHTRDELVGSRLWNTTTIDFRNSLTLTNLLSHKASVWLNNSSESEKLKSRETFGKTYEWLMNLLTVFNETTQEEIILKLSNHCYRDSLTRLANCLQVVSAESPVQGFSGFQGAFKLEQRPSHISRSHLLELIGRRGYESYSPNDKNGLSNLFENRYEDGSGDFLILLCIHWAINQTSRYSSSWPRLVDFQTLREYLEWSLPGSHLLRSMDWAIQRSEEMELIDKVMNQSDLQKVLHHVMPKAELLYNEIQDNSVIVTFCHCFFYLDESKRSNSFQKEIAFFIRSIRFTRLVSDFEEDLFNESVQKLTLWQNIFHKKLLSRHMLTGLEGSWNRWSDKKQGEMLELLHLQKRVESLERRYDRRN